MMAMFPSQLASTGWSLPYTTRSRYLALSHMGGGNREREREVVIAMAGGHIHMHTLSAPVEQLEGQVALFGGLGVHSQGDVGGDGLRMVHTKHTFHDQGGLVVAGQSPGVVSQCVLNLCHLSRE